MIKVHCSGCGISEIVDLPEHKIGTVKLTDFLDAQTWTAKPEYEADLCRECLGKVLHNYFGISAEGHLDIPAFIQPQSLKVVEGRE